MKLFKTKTLRSDRAYYYLERTFIPHLDNTQRQEMRKKFYNDMYERWQLPFLVIENQYDKTPKPNFIYRMSIIPWFICCLSMFLFMPFKFILTGRFLYNLDSPNMEWFFNWSKELGFNV